MNRRSLLHALALSPLAAATATEVRAETTEPSLWEKFYRTPLLRHEDPELPDKGIFIYAVDRGETMSTVAEKFYADPHHAKTIARWNNLPGNARLHTRQELKLVIPRFALLSAVEVMKKSDGGCTLETVASTRRFHPDELFRLRVSPNANGSLYAFNRDAGARWKRLHPASVEEASVTRFTEYVLPTGDAGWFRFDRDKGAEELVLFFAPDPIDELADVLDVPFGEELKEKQENDLDLLIERQEKAAKGITRVEGDSVKREAGAIIALGPDSGIPILVYRLRLLREA